MDKLTMSRMSQERVYHWRLLEKFYLTGSGRAFPENMS